MPCLMVRRHSLFIVGDDHAFALRAHQDLVLGLLEVIHRDRRMITTCGQQGRFVNEAFQVGTTEARCAARHPL